MTELHRTLTPLWFTADDGSECQLPAGTIVTVREVPHAPTRHLTLVLDSDRWEVRKFGNSKPSAWASPSDVEIIRPDPPKAETFTMSDFRREEAMWGHV